MAGGEVTELVIIRHGETVWNVEGRMQGQLDAPLTETGLRQAHALGEALAGGRFDGFYTSDLERALGTARIVAERVGLAAVIDARLRERCLGIMQGMTLVQFEQAHPEEWARFCAEDPDYALPEGESVNQRGERTIACAEELARRHGGGRVLIVTHGSVLSGLMRHVLGLEPAAKRRYSLFNAGINTFAVADGDWKLLSWGEIGHLRDTGTMDDW
jgi:probable phosphoglycerate mutase